MIRTALSVVILIMLGLQGMVTLRVERKFANPPPYLYPFIDYPMYNQPRYVGNAVPRERVIAVLADGTERLVEPDDLGLTYWIFRREIIGTLQAGEAERVALFADRVAERFGAPPTAFRLEVEPLILTEHGVEVGEIERVSEVWLPGAD